MSSLFILMSIAVIGHQCYGAEIEERIYNGVNASPGQFPYQALLFSFNNSNPNEAEFCGGSLISKSYVLTASHCVYNFTTTKVYLGITTLSDESNAAIYTVDHDTNVIQHEDYNHETSENDIAIIKLPEEVTLTRYIRTISLPKLDWADPNTFNNWQVTISGFGMTYDDDPNRPHDTLQYANVFKMPEDDCKRVINNTESQFQVTDGMICTDKKVNSGVCPGDSGGPLVVWYDRVHYVIGVADWIVYACINPYPGVFTNVAYYLEWINEKTGIPIS